MTNSDSVRAHISKARLDIRAASLLHNHKLYSHSIACSYYAVFHAIKAILDARGIDAGSHGQVLGAFNKNYVHTGEISSYPSQSDYDLFNKRNTLEYDPRELIGEEGSKIGVEMSTKAVDEIISYFGSHGISFDSN